MWGPRGFRLKVGDGEGLEVGGRGTGDIFVVGKIENANTWEAVVPTIRTGVFGDVGGGGELEERDTIAELDGLDPPVDVLKERGVQNDVEAGRRGAAFCNEDAVEKQTAGRTAVSRRPGFWSTRRVRWRGGR